MVKLKPATIEVYRAAITSVLKFAPLDFDPSSSRSVSNLFTRFSLDNPRQTSILPKWDLELVLRSLLKKPFVDESGRSVFKKPFVDESGRSVFKKPFVDESGRSVFKKPFVDESGRSDLSIPLPWFTRKTVFLVALASGARASEVHTLSRNSDLMVLEEVPGNGVSLRLQPYAGFTPRTALHPGFPDRPLVTCFLTRWISCSAR